MSEVERLQKNLLLIRRCVGWTAAEFGERIGVTRQTINNLESNKLEKFRLSKTQYLAMRKVLDDEMAASPSDTAMLGSILEILVDHPEKYPVEERKNVLTKANMLAPSILAKSSTRSAVSRDWMKDLRAGALGASVAAIVLVTKVVLDMIKTKE